MGYVVAGYSAESAWGVPLAGLESNARTVVGDNGAPNATWAAPCKQATTPATMGVALDVPLNELV